MGLSLLAGALIWVLFPHGKRPAAALTAVPLTGNRGYEAFPTFSPEGTRVAFAWEPPGTPSPNLYVKLLGPGDPVRLTTNPAGDFAPAWSPDGSSIAFLRTRGPSHAALLLIPAIGGPEREVAEITFEAYEMLRHWKSYVYYVSPPFLAWSGTAAGCSRWSRRPPGKPFPLCGSRSRPAKSAL
jgi:dipeptidyl aminopeptidase/acylaminoacyl peptidase